VLKVAEFVICRHHRVTKVTFGDRVNKKVRQGLQLTPQATPRADGPKDHAMWMKQVNIECREVGRE